jgi:hypothetical protein
MRGFTTDNKGIALVTALMLTLISLLIIMSVMTLITSSISRAGAQKRYRTATEAAYGGTEVVMKDMLPFLLKNFDAANLATELTDQFAGISLAVTSDACLKDKITKETGLWGGGCSQTVAAKVAPDFTFTLSASTGQPFTVYTKIIDTIGGNTDTSGLQLEGAGVAESLSVLTPMHLPYVYRVEVQGERSQNATEQANLSVLYAY